MDAQLTYYLFEGVLIGSIDRRRFHIPALSGGGGGSRQAAPANSANNPYMTALKTAEVKNHHVHGGPIPPGKYAIATPKQHPHLGVAAQLTPAKAQPMHGRTGFFIHGRGPHGSDGCIVPLHAKEFGELMQALARSGGGVLHVQEAMDGGRFA